jgi:lipopolysaccharide/colanic/teichoic acid biosynthesis glycosyltransferase
MKRTFDILCSFLALAALALPLLVIAGIVRTKLGAPVFFVQVRPGRDGRPFRMWKFRTMVDRNDPTGVPLPDEQRITRFGSWLRATSLDELPELWNVLCGDMSLVGPRPLLVRYLDRYTPEEARRHLVRPGLTGWAQVNGRNATTWDERLRLDVWYVDHRSMLLDLRILLKTVLIVFRREGINSPNAATMTEFRPPS